MLVYNMEKTGKACTSFDCEASEETIKKFLPLIRRRVKIPNRLELSLMKRTENQGISMLSNPKLWAIAMGVEETDMKYSGEATCPNATNCQTAGELASLLNQMYQSPLYQEKEPFRGEVVYKERGRYMFKE
jgi:hypothetical protein